MQLSPAVFVNACRGPVRAVARLAPNARRLQRSGVYEYFRSTFLALPKENSGFSVAAIKKILQLTGEALKELHDRNWIHLNITPVDSGRLTAWM